MDDRISGLQEMQILLAFIRYADKDGRVCFDTTEVWKDLCKIVGNGNWVDALLYKLNDAGVLYFEEIGEDGFKPITMAGVTKHTHIYLEGLAARIKEEYESLEKRITEILTFNPKALSATILETKIKLDEVSRVVSENELLKPIAKPLKEIQHHFESVSAVSSNYEDVYKNIIRPVREEGRSGVRATVKWAILSIFISTSISLVISNWRNVAELFNGA